MFEFEKKFYFSFFKLLGALVFMYASNSLII